MVCHITVSRELPVEEENIQTQLHKRSSEEHYTYTNVPWKIYLRKEASVVLYWVNGTQCCYAKIWK